MSLQVTVVSRAAQLFHGEASYVSAPSSEGEVGILPGRQPFLATMAPGMVRITLAGGEVKQVPVAPGFISVDSDRVTIVVDAV